MAKSHNHRQLLALPCLLILLSGAVLMVSPATLTFVNNCGSTVWPGILSNAGTAPLSTTGFALNSGDQISITAPPSWSGRLWGRTLCSQDPNTGKFTCLTGDCGSGAVECGGGGASPPATLAEFTLDGAGGLDFYDVSLVDGYNLPMLVVPQGPNCSVTGCISELNGPCPAELKVVGGVACKSACGAFGDARYCCSGEYATPDTCGPSVYSHFFKSACPKAYSYAYDDRTSTFTCAGADDYVITFCPAPATSQKSTGGEPTEDSGVSTLSSGGVLLRRHSHCYVVLIFLAVAIVSLIP